MHNLIFESCRHEDGKRANTSLVSEDYESRNNAIMHTEIEQTRMLHANDDS